MTVFFFRAEEVDNPESEVGRKKENVGSLSLKQKSRLVGAGFYGRRAESPIRMFKYLLLKTIYDISDVDVVERSMYNMSFKILSGYDTGGRSD